MPYRNMFLSALLVPCVLMGSENVETQIRELKRNMLELARELSKMSDDIIQQQELADNIMAEAQDISIEACKSLNEQDKEIFINEIVGFGRRLDSTIASGDVKGFFIKEFFNDKKNKNEFIRIKFLMIKRFIEYEILKELVRSYEYLIQRVIEIDREIMKLQD